MSSRLLDDVGVAHQVGVILRVERVSGGWYVSGIAKEVLQKWR